MNREETARVLAKIRACDNRDVGQSTVLAWHEILSDVDFEDALVAVSRHFAVSREWLMPVDIIEHAGDIADERALRKREITAAEMRRMTLEILGPPKVSLSKNRKRDVLRMLRATLPEGRPDKLRGPAWRAKNPGLSPWAERQRDDEKPSTPDGA